MAGKKKDYSYKIVVHAPDDKSALAKEYIKVVTEAIYNINVIKKNNNNN